MCIIFSITTTWNLYPHLREQGNIYQDREQWIQKEKAKQVCSTLKSQQQEKVRVALILTIIYSHQVHSSAIVHHV